MSRKNISFPLLLVVFLSSLLVLNLAFAEDCLREAQEAKQSGANHLVVSFEGLGSKQAGFVRNGLLKRIENDVGRIMVSKNYAYTEDAKAFECIKDFKNVLGKDLNLMVIGHSFGGGIAIFNLLDRMNGMQVDNVITLDPRSMDSEARFMLSKSENIYSKPNTVRIGAFYNFYQKGGLPGYAVKGAKNIELKGVNHAALPSHSSVQKLAKKLILD
ncbi:MAG: hypothetical protein M9962_07645 [Oligoflexia bacterium]|nr:hypothetical protein [Oligoflexia bacterium]